MRFSLIDRITDLQPGRSIVARKNLSRAEEYLADHFPGFPVMPGVLMVETMVQACAWLMRAMGDFRYSTVLLKEARAVRFNNFVVPGKTLEVSAVLQKSAEGEMTFKASGQTLEDGGTSVNTVSARLTLEQFNLAERNPDLAAADARGVEHARAVFQQIWQPAG